MPIMFGFSGHRRQQLVEEFRRMTEELPRLGVERAWLTGDLADNRVGPESDLEFVLVHETAERFHRRPDFFSTHLRPAVGTRFIVYTPAEFNQLREIDQILIDACRAGDELLG